MDVDRFKSIRDRYWQLQIDKEQLLIDAARLGMKEVLGYIGPKQWDEIGEALEKGLNGINIP